jgi:septin family protein
MIFRKLGVGVPSVHPPPLILPHRKFFFLFYLVEDEVHSDFIALRSMLIRTNLNDLRDVTHNIHYENYRYKKLSSYNGNDTKNGKTFQTSSMNK